MSLCLVYGCNYKTTHITNEHSCSNCGRNGHGKVECGNNLAINFLNEINEYDNITSINDLLTNNNVDIKSILTNLKDGYYTSIYSGLGSKIFIRKTYKDRFQFLFMHQDDWGQYGVSTSRKNKYDKFISGYKEIKI